jgi:hypothetical protein
MITRLLTMSDQAQAKALWLNTFDDPPAFVDWFFENRYHPEWSVGVFDGSDLISVVHGTPMNLSLGKTNFPALMTSGVATAERERGKGHMHDAMRFLQAYGERNDIHALFNHPQRLGAYAHLGFQPITFTKYWKGTGKNVPGQIAPFSEEEAFQVYSAIADRYAGFVRRDRAAFRLKMEDYASDGAKGFLMQEAGRIVGYCVYFDKEEVQGEEVLSLTGYGPLLHELKRIAQNKNVYAKLPPDADREGEIRPQNVMLAPDAVWKAIKTSGLPAFCVDEY